MLKIRDLERRLGWRHILSGVNLDIGVGEICMVCGENGSGKSTLLDLIAGVFPAHRGQVHINGYSIERTQARALLGYAPAAATLPEHLRVHEWVDLVGALRGIPRSATDPVISLWGIDRLQGAPLRTLSLGERRRLLLATAEFGAPELLLLDEPTVGLDGAGQELLVNRLQARGVAGKSSLVATHDMELVQVMNSKATVRVVTLAGGKIC